MKGAKDSKGWIDGTFIERDAEAVSKGISDNWRDFPDVDVTAYINAHDIEDLPVIWIDNDCYTYLEAMNMIRNEFSTALEPEIKCDNKSCKLTA